MQLQVQVESERVELVAVFDRPTLTVWVRVDHLDSSKAGQITLTDRNDVEALRDHLDMALCHWPAPDEVEA